MSKRARPTGNSVVTFGEVMLRLATERKERIVQARSLEGTYGGGECNVAVSLANFGLDAAFVSAVPEHEVGQACVNYIRQFGVDTSHILRQGPRLGTYFLESGASMRLASSRARATPPTSGETTMSSSSRPANCFFTSSAKIGEA